MVTPLNKLQILWIITFTKVIKFLGNQGRLAKLAHKLFMTFQPARLRFFKRVYFRLLKSSNAKKQNKKSSPILSE